MLDNVKACALEIFSRAAIPLPPTIDPSFGIDAIFVVHYTPLTERKAVMEQRVRQQFNVSPIFLTDFDREVLSDEDIDCLVEDRRAQLAFINRPTKRGEDSLSAKHMAIYHFMIRHSLQNVLVLEDDAKFLHKDWKSEGSIWQKILASLPSDYDMLFVQGPLPAKGKFVS
jgi:hypothetical protein